MHESSLFAAVSKQPYSGGGGTNDDKEQSPSYAATHSCYASFTQMTNMLINNDSASQDLSPKNSPNDKDQPQRKETAKFLLQQQLRNSSEPQSPISRKVTSALSQISEIKEDVKEEQTATNIRKFSKMKKKKMAAIEPRKKLSKTASDLSLLYCGGGGATNKSRNKDSK